MLAAATVALTLASCAASAAEIADPPHVTEVAPAIVSVAARATQCDTSSFATGLVIATDRILTNAHSVAGADRVVIADSDGNGTPGSVVYFDPKQDLAIVAATGFDAVPLTFSGGAAPGDAAIVTGHRLGGVNTIPVMIESRDSAVAADIYGGSTITLDYWTIAGVIEPGISGSPLITENGIIGLVFAQADGSEPRGFALAATHLTTAVENAPGYTIKVDTGPCLRR